MKDLFKNNFLIAIQLYNSENDLSSHSNGFSNYKYSFSEEDGYKEENIFSVFPNEDITTGEDFLKYIEYLNINNSFKTISIACIGKELYCAIFGLNDQEYDEYIKSRSNEVAAEENFKWLSYSIPFENKICFRIPKEIILGSIVTNENKDLIFIYNKNYIDNLSNEEKQEFINQYKELILNQVEDENLYNNCVSKINKKI